jgi:hypothetical protein
MKKRRLDGWGWLLLLFGAGAVANALWMLAEPLRWYHDLPAGVPDTGPFNEHFVRDIGCAFLAVGVAQVWAAFAPVYRAPLVAVAALFAVGHALLHIYDTARGAVPGEHWWLDLPGVYLPAAVLGVAALVLLRAGGGEHAPRTDRTT